MHTEEKEQQKSLAHADLQFSILNGSVTEEDLYIQQRQQEEKARLKAEFRAKKAKEEAQEKERDDLKAFSAEQKARFERIDREREQWKTPPKKTQCAVCGETVVSTVLAHVTSNGFDLCVRDPERARKAGMINSTQYQIIMEEGNLQKGHIFTDAVSGNPTKDERSYENTTAKNAAQPVNPLTLPYEPRTVRQMLPDGR